MRFATLDNGTRDGQLVAVSQDGLRCAPVPGIATLQAALDDWAANLPVLGDTAAALEKGEGEAFDASRALAPLPRAYQWMDASGYLSHLERVRRARGASLPPGIREEPIIYQGLSDRNLAWNAPLPAAPGWGADFEGELAVIVDDVPQGVDAQDAGKYIRLVVLLNDVSLRELIPGELAKGFGFFVSKPASAFAPVAVTPDELGPGWNGRALAARMEVDLNGIRLGTLRTGGAEQHFDFPAIIAYAARTRAIGAGSIVGAGTVSNADEGAGVACLAEKRVLEQIHHGKPSTPWLVPGDRLKIRVLLDDGRAPFGAIEQEVAAA
ncbi:MAG: fumarylacetoacetate hydrolase family protein [Burkholderiaceae bacterium]